MSGNEHINRQQDVSDAQIVSDTHRDNEVGIGSERDAMGRETQRLDPLFSADLADDYRARWRSVQGSFIDDPRKAVAKGDELVAQVLKTLGESFDRERDRLEQELSRTGEASTETLRLGLRRYRSLFERLLSV